MTPFVRSLVFVLIVIAAASGFGAAASAQGLGKSGNALVDQQRTVIDGLTFRTNEIETDINDNAGDDLRLVEFRLQLEEMARELIISSVSFRPRLTEINDRLDKIGAAPAAGAADEPDIVRQERDKLVAEKAEINAALGVAEDLSIRVNMLVTRITDMRRDLFSNLLTKRYEISYALGGEVIEGARAATRTLYRSVSAWLHFVFNFKLSSALGAAFFALGAAAVLLVGGRRTFGHLIEPDPDRFEPTYLSRLSVAFWSTLMPTAALGVFLGATYFFFDYFKVLRGDIGAMLSALFGVVGLVFFVHRLGKAVLAPDMPAWRLIPVESGAARKLLWIMSATAVLSGLDYFLKGVYETVDAPLSLTVGEALIATVLIGSLVFLSGFVRPFADEQGRPKRWPVPIRYSLFSLGLVTIGFALFGYIGMARFLSQQIVWTGAVLATMYLGFLSSRAVSEEGAFAHTAMGVRAQRWFGVDDTGLDQFGLLVSVVINIMVVVIGLPLILLQWGFQPGDIEAWVYRIATGIQIGSFTLSLVGIFWGVVVFGVGYVITRWFQGWLDGSVMARGRVDSGVRNSIRTIVGYAGLALAGLVALSAAGIDFSNLALIAGGLSLGIGFGLQNVVSNFVSGLILLAERPFKAGDWIVAGPISGTVKKISVRATEIETFQRQTVILPNSELINGAVGNWTHRNNIGRIEVAVGVAYGSDARKVHGILLDLARSHALILKNPEPFVVFSSFADAAMMFEIRAFLADVTNGGIVQNDLRFAILETFAREHIEIPAPMRQMRIWEEQGNQKWPSDDDKAEAELADALRKQTEDRQRFAAPGRSPRKKADPG